MPPPMSIGKDHTAYENIINNRPHLGEVPVMGRMQTQITIAAGLILVLAATFGAVNMSNELKPLRELAKFADDPAAGSSAGAVPYKNSEDETGALAQDLDRIVVLQSNLAHLAYTDYLTKLGNRSRYLADLTTGPDRISASRSRKVCLSITASTGLHRS